MYLKNYNWRAGVIILTGILLSVQLKAQPEKPNIILIMADDLGYETLECNGGTSYQTPRLNAMAQSGMRFEHCYANPLCTPSRVQLMTGKYNFRNYIGFGLLDPANRTFAHLLKEAGYVTGITGKWQLLGLESEQKEAGNRRGTYPVEAGFDEYCLWQVDQRLSRYQDPIIRRTGQESKEYPGQYGPDIFSGFANDFVTRHRDTTFFLYYPMVLVHDPFHPVPGSKDYPDKAIGTTNDTTYFAGMVHYMDKIAGDLLDNVKALGISRKTLIIFVGDNGTNQRVFSTANGTTVQGGKSTFTRYGTHVPMIAYWDGVIAPGQVNSNLVDFTDFLPTFNEIAGLKLPPDFHSDGLSFYSQLSNAPQAKTREWVFCSYNPKRGKRKAATWIHTREWKLYQTGEFYDFAKDPKESHPLSDTELNPAARAIKNQLSEAMSAILNQ